MKIEQTVVNIIFDAGKGSVTTASREGVCGEPFGNLPRPVRPGYAFAGWYLGEELVSAETVLNSETDVRLVARWEKKKGDRAGGSMLRRQRAAALVLAVVILALAVGVVFANNLVQIYSLKDTYFDEDGNEQTVTYLIKKNKEDGLYGLYNKQGTRMEQAPDNGFNHYTDSDGVQFLVYETDVSGNQYRINTATGAYELYAVVDTENEEVLGGTVVSTRVMMYPRIKQSEVYSIEVTNEKGSYKFYRKTVANTAANATTPYTSQVTVSVNGEDANAVYDPETYALLCVTCGYSLSMNKLDLSDPAAPRLADGSIDYSVYGLQTYKDDGGNVDYTRSPAVFTITKAQFAADGSCSASDTSYTVEVGDALVSGGGYYVRLQGREAVYIVNPDVASTVLCPVEALVKPMVVYPMSVSTYVMVFGFTFSKIDSLKVENPDDVVRHPITEFNFVDLSERENTIYTATPYWIPEDSETKIMQGYQIDNDSVSAVMYNLYSMEFLACKKIAPKGSDLDACGLSENVWELAYLYDPEIASGGSENYIVNHILISRKTYDEELGAEVYYIYSSLYDMIVAVDPYYASFVEWEQSHWYDQYLFRQNLSYTRYLTIEAGDRRFDFTMDNSKSDLSQTFDTSAIKIYCEQFNGKSGHLLDYEIEDVQTTDTGTTKVKTVTALDNFRRLYTQLLMYSIEGDVNEAEFKKSVGKTPAELIASDVNDDLCTARIAYRVQDNAATQSTAKDADGNPIYTKDNGYDAVIRFYEYGSGRKMFLTIEVVDQYDADGNPIYDATKAQGNFYALTSPLNQLLGYADDLLNQVLLPSTT